MTEPEKPMRQMVTTLQMANATLLSLQGITHDFEQKSTIELARRQITGAITNLLAVADAQDREEAG